MEKNIMELLHFINEKIDNIILQKQYKILIQMIMIKY